MNEHKIRGAGKRCKRPQTYILWKDERAVARAMMRSVANDHVYIPEIGIAPPHARRFRDHDYFVTQAGEIYRGQTGQKLKNCANSAGYLTLRMSENGVKRSFRIHRMVWECWRGPVPPGMVVNHKDFDKLNPTLPNLELMTQSENVAHAAAAGRMGRRRSNG